MIAAAPVTCAPNDSCGGNRLARGSAGRNHVFDDEHAIGRVESEPATEDERSVLALGENRPDTERAPDFLADHDAAERRRQDDRRLHVARALGQRVSKRLGELRVLEHQRALQVAIAVQARRQPEMPLEERTGLPEQIEHAILIH